jgi:cathepsin L
VTSILTRLNAKRTVPLSYSPFAQRALRDALAATGKAIPRIADTMPLGLAANAVSVELDKLTEDDINQIFRARLKQLTGLSVPKDLPKRVQDQHARAQRVKAGPRLRSGLGARQPVPTDSRLDWRDKGLVVQTTGIVTAVQYQGSCGCCWAFATIGALEASYALNDIELIGASEQDILNCASASLSSALQQPFSCDGGWWAFDMLWPGRPDGPLGPGGGAPGVARRSDVPYLSQPDVCKNVGRPYSVLKWDYVSQNSDPNALPDKNLIKSALCQYGPLGAAVYVPENEDGTNAWANNQGELIADAPNASAGTPNHAIVIVGWDNNKFGGCWIFKNSWDTVWGENGFGYVQYDYNNMGSGAAWVIAAPMPAQP